MEFWNKIKMFFSNKVFGVAYWCIGLIAVGGYILWKYVFKKKAW